MIVSERTEIETEVELDRVTKRFEDESGRAAVDPTTGKPLPSALSEVSIAVRKGELLVVVGPSGCGSPRRCASSPVSKMQTAATCALAASR